MKTFEFHVRRPMDGDRHYEIDDTRELAIVDAAHLVRSGALEPKGKEALAAAEEHLGPREQWGVRPVSGPGPGDDEMERNNARAAAEGAQPRPVRPAGTTRGKDAGNAAQNKGDVTAPAAGTVHAGDPGAEVVGEPEAGAPPPPPPPPPPTTTRTTRSRSRGGKRR